MSAACTARRCPEARGSECHCAACHLTFGTLTLFDAHQTVDYDRRPPVICRAAESMRVSPAGLPVPAGSGGLALVRDARGTWQTPAGLAARQRSAAMGRERGRK